MKPLVFCGIYPVNAKDFLSLREAMEKVLAVSKDKKLQAEARKLIGNP